MPVLRLLCLANSRKLGGQCIAGLRLDNGRWIRPVSNFPDGTLYPSNYRLNDGSTPQLLDIIEVGLESPRPAQHQPENWLIDGTRWRLVRRPGTRQEIDMMWSHVTQGPALFGNCEDRVPEGANVGHSLTLVRVQNLRWRITSYGEKRKTRALFGLSGTVYDLAITDNTIEQGLGNLEEGIHLIDSAPGFSANQEVLLTISLGEPFEGNCYKLVAAIIPLS